MMTPVKLKTLIIPALLILLIGSACGSTQDYTFHWNPCPVQTEDGQDHSPAAYYQVHIMTDQDTVYLETTTVTDTIYALQTDQDMTYQIRVCGVDATGRTSPLSEWSDTVYVPRTSHVPIPEKAHLHPAYPNPFNPSTRIAYDVPENLAAGDHVSLQIHDLQGRLVRSFTVDRAVGPHTVQWHGRNDQGRHVAAGIYLARYLCGSHQQMVKLSLVK